MGLLKIAGYRSIWMWASMLLCILGGTANAQTATPVIGGQVVQCASLSGIPVLWISNPALPDVGRARPGNPPTIEMNPAVLANLPPALQLYWAAHECGHHRVGASEVAADCWAARTGREQKWFTEGDLPILRQVLANNPGSVWGHLPGPRRYENIESCFRKVAQPSSSCEEKCESSSDRCQARCDRAQDPDRCAERCEKSLDRCTARCSRNDSSGSAGSRGLPRYCCTQAGRLGPYQNPDARTGVPVQAGESCYGTTPMGMTVFGQACH
jgi:hypothetical protein